ncbi:murein L,D-transpeptidase catalytic domain family protein [Sphingomonas cavernae]|uniref:Murein L,D-transpeptidase catalytic domain family protein n=1 Tax=Sphingomonas cavernae TaxID=2320861 RepID=A0A418WRG6_9SPHN|nr:murein L,D-transpeptidase catalytic domain family protein [Sphingomonas cavernae]RJF93811.1 hypothetical protein D3876_05855 [Sphingomonas cavernae]
MDYDRRSFLLSSIAAAGSALLVSSSASATAETLLQEPVTPPLPPVPPVNGALAPRGVHPNLFAAAKGALDRHVGRVQRDRIGIVDFASPSSQPRFHLVDLGSGATTTLLVSHGSGSDPGHSGWLERFSNVPGSNASSEGAYLTGDYYVGKHGRSQRLIGLDRSNDNALARAIVVHGAWYAEPTMIGRTGKLGRSQGCFAVGDNQLRQVFDHLGQGRLIYAAKMTDRV